MSYSNTYQSQTPRGGSSQQRNNPGNMSYAPLSQPQTNEYLNYHPSNPNNISSAYLDTNAVPWPYGHVPPEYNWEEEVPTVPFGEYFSTEDSSYISPNAFDSSHANLPCPTGSYMGDYAGQYPGAHGAPGWHSHLGGDYNLAPSLLPETVNPQQLFSQNPSAQTTGSRTRRRRSSPSSQASSSGATSDAPSYQIIHEKGREVYVCLCGCRRRYGRYNEWMRAHEHTAVSCPICGRGMSRPDALLRHLKNQHNVHPAH